MMKPTVWGALILVSLLSSITLSSSYAAQNVHRKKPVKPTISKSRNAASKTRGGLTQAQNEAVETALKSLRKLQAATEVGVSLTSYQNRLIDTKADVDEALRSIPPGSISNAIQTAMQSYQDASTFWSACIQLQHRYDIINATEPILNKYGLVLNREGPLPPDGPPPAADATVEELKQQVDDGLAALVVAGNINDTDQNRILSAIWANASRCISEAKWPSSLPNETERAMPVPTTVPTADPAVRADSTRVVERAGVYIFSYVPPTGWQTTLPDGQKFQLCYGGTDNNIPRVLGLQDVNVVGSCKEYANQVITLLTEKTTSPSLLNQSAFVTSSGLQGLKLICEATKDNMRIRFTYYIFLMDGGDKLIPGNQVSTTSSHKLVALACWSASAGNEYEKITDVSMKTLSIEPAAR